MVIMVNVTHSQTKQVIVLFHSCSLFANYTMLQPILGQDLKNTQNTQYE
jgi:hypothetical protein